MFFSFSVFPTFRLFGSSSVVKVQFCFQLPENYIVTIHEFFNLKGNLITYRPEFRLFVKTILIL